MKTRRWLTVCLLSFPAGADGVEDAGDARLPPIIGTPVAVGEPVPWQTDGQASAVLTLELPAPGFLSVVARSDSGADLKLTIADRMGVPYPGAHFDFDPPALTGGESAAVLVPAGRVTVVVGSWDGAASGALRTAWLEVADAAETPVASADFLDAASVANGDSFVTALPAKWLPHDRTVFYLPPRATPGTIGLAFDPLLSELLLLGVYPSDQPWEQTYDYALGEGSLDLSAAAGVGYFLVVEQWEDTALPLTLTRRDPGVPETNPPGEHPSPPATPDASQRPRRAPR